MGNSGDGQNRHSATCEIVSAGMSVANAIFTNASTKKARMIGSRHKVIRKETIWNR